MVDEVGDQDTAVSLRHRPDEADQFAHAVEAADFLELRRHRRREVRGEGAGRLAPPALVPAWGTRGGAVAEFVGEVGDGGFIAGGIGGVGVGGGDGGHAAILGGGGEIFGGGVCKCEEHVHYCF